MTYLEFVEKIKSIPSPYEAYLGRGLTDEFINSRIQSYFAKPKLNVAINDYDDEVIKLIIAFEITELTISMISFLNHPLETDEVVFFGGFEVDGLAIYKPTGEIRCYENQSDHLLWRCALNGNLFLDALYEAGCFLKKRSLNEDLYFDEKLGEEVANYCAELAGGNQYFDFYNMMFS